jgi:poly(hydroxyalkanoate) granule-associated protein
MKEKVMARKIVKKVARSTKPAGNVVDSAQKVWLAGIGAVAKAKDESGKIVEALADQAQVLVSEGRKIEARFKAVAVEKAKEAQAAAKSRTTETLNSLSKLEGVFEKRVSRALNTFGIPSSKQVHELTVRMQELQKSLNQLKRPRPRA